MTDRRGQRGFTLAETLVAIAIFVVVAALLATTLQHALLWGRTIATRQTEHAQFEALLEHIHAEEDTAWAIYTPAADVLGQPNADGHEFDMFMRDGDNRPYFWAYRYDASAHTITKYVYPKPGAAAVSDAASIVNGVASFTAATYTIDKLADATSPVYSPLYAGKTLTPVAIHYGYGPEVAGGNQITALTLSGTTAAESLQLSTQTAPTGFTVRFHYTKGALNVVPATVVYALAGRSLGDHGANERYIIAQTVNGLLGGALADAAACPAKALDKNGNEIRPGSAEAQTLGITSADGCYDGHITAQEPGYSGSFLYRDPTGVCASTISPLGWNPTVVQRSQSSNLYISAGSTAAECQFAISDIAAANLQSQNVSARVTGYFCTQVGESCTVSEAPWPNDNPGCDTQGGGYQNGYEGVGSYSTSWGTLLASSAGSVMITPYGNVTVNADESITFVRTGTGSMSVAAHDRYATFRSTAVRSGWTCLVSVSNPIVATWSF